ncbi:sulfurtransferase complex subunit TusB [Xenorhabdus cabanillasii]|uniref:Protein TusB n=1 Tax=Xenorhabdus cabanillasii JM26 TaxID=1427517 RepID=W1JBR7_9GAMM|nr:sulfurtransferase complex subunit TusB [Xenorhabdus cabanillasii]PHM79128.1 tRNA 2-thiouridine synthase TusB [Xenorhabdus cabanillasii JM26]CDL87518.1 Protein tusB [Xenorhabdus cabanillasii JM26]
MLYTVRCSPYQDDFNAILGLITDADDVLLIQNGVLLSMNGNRYLAGLIRTGAGIYALQDDLDARGLTNQVSDRVQVVNYNGFVSLTVKHQQSFSW